MTLQELFWKRGLGSFVEQDAVDWALTELDHRPPSANLGALAGLVPPYNSFEVEDLLRHAFLEIGVEEPEPKQSYRDYLRATAERILSGAINERDGCRLLAAAYRDDLDRGEIQAFWLLDWAVRDYEAQGHQYYDERFDGQNLKALVRLEAERLRDEMNLPPHDAV